jgi:TolB-like protein
MRESIVRSARGLVIVGLALAVAACAAGAYYYSAGDSNLIRGNYAAADVLVAPGWVSAGGGPILVATVVDINQLDRSSTLGRLISEHVASRLALKGYTVTELKITGPVYVRTPEGELMLSREVKTVSAKHGAQAVAVGTYAPETSGGNGVVFVSLKLVRMSDNTIVGASDYALVLAQNNYGLLRTVAR